MPIYEYRCSACGFQKEYLQKITDSAMVICPECQQETLVKMLSAAGFQLKGSGWYVTDFRSSQSAPSQKQNESDRSAQSTQAESSATPAATTTDSTTPVTS